MTATIVGPGGSIEVANDVGSAIAVADASVAAGVSAVLAELADKLEAGGTVALDAGTLAALETVNVNGAATETTLAAINSKLTDLSGTWGYSAGVNGTVVLSGSKRVIGIAAHATVAGSFTINGGDAIAVPANSSIEVQPIGNLVDPTLVFSADIDSYFVETVV